MTTHARAHSFERDSAGTLMITDVPRIPHTATIADVKHLLTQEGVLFSFSQEVYVLTKTQRLAGVVPLPALFHHDDSTSVSSIMRKADIVAHPHTDQEHVAYMALRHQVEVIPIVDKRGVFRGVIPPALILAIMEKEIREDVLHIAGVHHAHGTNDDIMTLPLRTALRHRLPWLLLGLVGGLLSARIIGSFEYVLNNYFILATFIPLIVYMGDAVGTQMEAFIIRDITVNDHFRFVKYFLRQLAIVMLIGVITSIVLFVASIVFYQDQRIAEVLAIALGATIVSSVLTGLIIPYLFSRLRIDPANASGPIATNIQDLLSITLYLLIASAIL